MKHFCSLGATGLVCDGCIVMWASGGLSIFVYIQCVNITTMAFRIYSSEKGCGIDSLVPMGCNPTTHPQRRTQSSKNRRGKSGLGDVCRHAELRHLAA